ncbi:hypothetical protein IEQ34_018028 [Dendrobium chrysotoxum]|uniref:Uncharacterized protein n=1 Tax=Dendrobium chrysotoxum TaxID=161865 RepID=A0AAV7FVP0_DENCH|nr:hypothetical protein IEQ34_018028 [Dendrobium chrysotoxum]
MDEFPSFYDHYKSLGHFKKECVSLHSHLANVPTTTRKPVTTADMETFRLIPLVVTHPMVEHNMDVGNETVNIHNISTGNPVLPLLAVCDSSTNWDIGEDNDGFGNGSQEMYDLNVIQVDNEGFTNAVGQVTDVMQFPLYVL